MEYTAYSADVPASSLSPSVVGFGGHQLAVAVLSGDVEVLMLELRTLY